MKILKFGTNNGLIRWGFFLLFFSHFEDIHMIKNNGIS